MGNKKQRFALMELIWPLSLDELNLALETANELPCQGHRYVKTSGR